MNTQPYQPVKIVIADDHALFREGVKSVFAPMNSSRVTVSGEAKNGKEVIEMVRVMQPDIVLMDVEMPVMDGKEATAIIKERYPLVRTIALSCWDDRNAVLDMINAGADGYLIKDSSIHELTTAILSVNAGIPYFTPMVNIHLTARLREKKFEGEKNHPKNLTKRETDILQMICNGDSSKQIATSLKVSKRTIDTFREKIMKKANVRNVIGLLRYAIKHHLLKN